MTKPFDPIKSYKAVKAHEGMIGFTGFQIKSSYSGLIREGILKISSSYKAYGGGYLTLTFIVDTGEDYTVKEDIVRCFQNITEESLRNQFSQTLLSVVKVSLDSLANMENWYIEEIRMLFPSLHGNEKTLVEHHILPSFETVLTCSFRPVQWWPVEHGNRERPPGRGFWNLVIPDSVRTFFRGLLTPNR